MADDTPPRPLSLFDVVERIQGTTAWGSVLDAGTGVKSARWISSLPTSRWTAVSADPGHLAETREAEGTTMRSQDRLILGNWDDPALLAGETYNTVLAEYLLGAVEGFAPYFQHNLFARLRPLVGRRLYVIGIDPYVVGQPADAVGRVVQDVGRFRDACALLAGVTPYREYPAEWVMERLEGARLRIVFAQRFPNRYDIRWVDQQLTDSRMLIERIADQNLSKALAAQATTLRGQAASPSGKAAWPTAMTT